MIQSLYKIAEEARLILGTDKADIQSIIATTIECYASAVAKEWYQAKAEGVSEVSGIFLVPFKNIVPVLDNDNCMYYITNPSSYVNLPCEYGINFVGYEKEKKGFVRINAGSLGMFASIKAGILGGGQTYYVEGTRTYFPKMTNLTNGNIMVRYTIAFDSMDVDADLNIPPNVASNIVDMVIAKYAQKTPVIPEKLN
jgi:hypothetical protein